MKNKFTEAGSRIAELRAGMTQADFAARLGVDRKTVVRWEAGERLPDGASLFALMAEFGADVNYILTGQRGQPNTPEAALTVDERVLLNNYRACNDQARQNLIQTSALLSAGMAVPGTPTRPKRPQAKATGGVTQTVSGFVGGSVVAGNYKGQ